MTNNTPEYDIQLIRQLLLAAFTAEDLRRFCYYHPAFRPVVDKFGPSYGLADIVDELITYCETRLLFPELLAEVRDVNPRQYARFEPGLRRPTDRPPISIQQPPVSTTPLQFAPAVPVAEAQRAQVFLCYARQDGETVGRLYQALSDAGFKPWMDTKDILGGENWEASIERAIRNSAFFLACLSPRSVSRRGYIQKEIKRALDIWQEMLMDDIYLIPVRLEPCEVPESLHSFHWVNMYDEDGWTRLLTALQAGLERRQD